LELGDSYKVEVGDDIYFIGFPYAGNLMNEGWGITLIANRGMISNIKLDGGDPSHPRSFFIVDAVSNPGNSGCPLIDIAGNKVIGVMSVAFRIQSKVNQDLDIREPMHISGARPINFAKKFIAS
jgi:S1-C subfamily serine protease